MKWTIRGFFQNLITSVLILSTACKTNTKDVANTLFESLPAESTGVHFANQLNETEQWNIIQYLYFYNGGGVAVGDINNDSLPDIYFTANQGENKLYLNKGNLQFEDITAKAGVADADGWKTGVTMADVNADGWLDIYVSHVSDYKGLTTRNRLFMNNQNGTFTDQAERLGLAIGGLCTQSVFFDYDGDGDLDCYVLRHSVHSARSYRPISFRKEKDDMSGDLLLKNFGGRFADVTEQSGIADGSLGYGLGIAVGDINGDRQPDIYIGNDFHDNDYLYYNKLGADNSGKKNEVQKALFTEGVTQSMGHNSNFSMGNDLADMNNDGLLDFIGLDMKPEEEPILKASGAIESYNLYDFKNKEYGYHYQYPRNTLQLNRGIWGGVAHFSDVAQMMGLDATDWSWASLCADFDNDGWKDVYITNGILRRPNDLDYIKYISSEQMQQTATDLQLAQQMPDGKAANYAYRNKGGIAFENTSESWGLAQYGLSNGAAYADLDRDGDLDLVVNNINAKAFILKNKSETFSINKFLNVKLIGKGGNTQGVGAQVMVYAKGMMQMLEQQPTRGFQSSVEPILHFGLYNAPNQGQGIDFVDSVRVVWRDGMTQVFKIVPTNSMLSVKQRDAKDVYQNPQKTALNFTFNDISTSANIKYRHRDNVFYDNEKEKLIPHFLSTEGPRLAIGDVNSDGVADFYAGGSKGFAGQLFIHKKKEGFETTKQTAFEKDKDCEDVSAAFFDADGDKDLDLYVVSGGNELEEGYQTARDRLYLNDGKGNFSRKADALPIFFHNGACVKPCDFDKDGDWDVFVGSRSDLRDYGASPKSQLLVNDGKGNFKELPPQLLNGLDSVGMVTDAVWLDLNKDGWQDLVVVGQWMPITVFYFTGEDFIQSEIENTEGWWRCVEAADLDNDGDKDLLLGNMGLNSNWRASRTQPMRLFIKDFDGNGDREPIITYYRQGVEWLYASKDELTAQLPSLRKRFTDYAPFAKSPFDKVFGQDWLQGAQAKSIKQFASVCLLSKGSELELKPLPDEVQYSTVESFLVEDFDGDGKMDIALGGNFYEMQPSIGRFDASYGSVLKGDGAGNFTALTPTQTGWQLRGAVRDIRRLGNWIIVASNGNPLQVFELKK